MNSQGYTKDNIHKGNTKIVAGGIDVDGLIRIGDQSAGGDGYVLPAVKGTEGQVLTMNADNTSSFQDASSGVSGRFVKNLYTMIDRNASFSSTPQDVYSTGYGSLDLGSIDNFPVGATIHLYTKGTWQTSGGLVPANFSLIINDGEPTSVTFDGPVLSMTNNNQRYFYNDLILQRTGTNEYKFKGTGLTSAGGSGDPATSIFYPASTFSPTSPFTSLDLRFTWTTTNSNFYPLTTTFIVDMILDSSLLVATPPAPTSHTALTDLTAGDAGHTQFALLQGRSGGQVLSGGITPANFLTLKSHTAGLNNIVIKDLNTTFEKNLQIGTNQILDTLNNSIDFIGGDMNLLNTSLTNRIVVASQNNIDILANNQIKLQVPNVSGNNVVITSTDTSLNQALNMNNNNINNVLNINSASNINLNPTGVVDINGDIDMGGNRIIGVPEIVGDGTNMTIRNGGGISVLFDQATSEVVLPNNNLNMNNNVIKNVNNVISSGTLNLESSGGGSQSIQLDGTFITFFNNTITPSITPSGIDLNNGAITNVVSINNITPVGGLFAGTADSLTLTASTAEQSILPTAFVGPGLSIPPNGFSIGDSFHCVLAGDFGSNNGDTLTIRLKAGPTSTTILATLVVPLNNSSSSSFEAEIDFQLRNIGGAGVADICSNFDFTYNQSGGGGAFVGERGVFQNNTTFDTTLLNTLEITAQFSSNNASNTIKTIVSKLSKDF